MNNYAHRIKIVLLFAFVFQCIIGYGQSVELVRYQFTNSNTNPDPNLIGSPSLALSGLNYSGSYGNPFSSLYTNVVNSTIELTISTLGCQDISCNGSFYVINGIL